MASIETQSKIDIISKALILCGERPLTSLTDNRYGATVGSNLFELIYENEIQSNPWRFSMKKKLLSQLVDVPLNSWRYAYQLPSDMLLPRGVIPVDPIYEIFGTHLYSNFSSVELDYQFKPDITACPAYFSLLMVYAMAKNMGRPIKENGVAAEELKKMYNEQRNVALYADAQGRPAKQTVSSPFVNVRYGR
jgi:hypothetical protein